MIQEATAGVLLALAVVLVVFVIARIWIDRRW
jgi:hypothetical protein